jgi:hypothetical protein
MATGLPGYKRLFQQRALEPGVVDPGKRVPKFRGSEIPLTHKIILPILPP